MDFLKTMDYQKASEYCDMSRQAAHNWKKYGIPVNTMKMLKYYNAIGIDFRAKDLCAEMKSKRMEAKLPILEASFEYDISSIQTHEKRIPRSMRNFIKFYEFYRDQELANSLD